ncbi:DUF1836 domain-containing protein [Sinanaerobacter sp. ZZT-01]|uniref:DUF1836 domain-containing protein n=1 Tax=Sinanaerobacter sp. ZZT-01 TaxID=3111540 RepID=UPI002D77348D|nr:DUF1836 domain-containing protein [Sinanaerobacter sp. ZZT-01]WRR94155.1 DUF1836 domain-containing protein [Sinanaerobacter sp. ZZT-01]
MRYEEFIKQTVEEFVGEGVISGDAFPDMELYMDQAVLFINKHLNAYKREEKDKVMTKTMVSNYVKHHLIPRPKNKKYTKDHLILLTLIFYLKGTFQMEEIQTLMKPLIENYNSEFDEKFDFYKIYNNTLNLYKEEQGNLLSEVTGDIDRIKKNLDDDELADDDTTELFMLIVNLSMKANAQKFLAQKLMNEYFNKDKSKK